MLTYYSSVCIYQFHFHARSQSGTDYFLCIWFPRSISEEIAEGFRLGDWRWDLIVTTRAFPEPDNTCFHSINSIVFLPSQWDWRWDLIVTPRAFPEPDNTCFHWIHLIVLRLGEIHLLAALQALNHVCTCAREQ